MVAHTVCMQCARSPTVCGRFRKIKTERITNENKIEKKKSEKIQNRRTGEFVSSFLFSAQIFRSRRAIWNVYSEWKRIGIHKFSYRICEPFSYVERTKRHSAHRHTIRVDIVLVDDVSCAREHSRTVVVGMYTTIDDVCITNRLCGSTMTPTTTTTAVTTAAAAATTTTTTTTKGRRRRARDCRRNKRVGT